MVQYLILLLMALPLFGVACGSANTPTAQPPQVACQLKATNKMATLCAKGVALKLGPTDAIESYTPIHGLQLLILPRTMAESLFPEGISSPNALRLPTSRLGQDALKHRQTPDREGNLSVTVAPGAYLVCAVNKSIFVPGEEVSWCELVALNGDILTKLLITHSPWGDRLGFDWQSEPAPPTLESGDMPAPAARATTLATPAPTKTPNRRSGTTATLPRPPLLPEGPTPRDFRNYLDAWPDERKIVFERDLVVIFTYPHPAVAWDQTASLYHIPSMSRVDLNSAGKVAITRYGNEEGRQAVQGILADVPRMNLIRSLISWE